MAASQYAHDVARQKDNDQIPEHKDVGSASQKPLNESDILSRYPTQKSMNLPKSSGNMSSENTYENISALNREAGFVDDNPIPPSTSTEDHIYAMVVKEREELQQPEIASNIQPAEKYPYEGKHASDLRSQDHNTENLDLPRPYSSGVSNNTKGVDAEAQKKLCSPETAKIYVIFKPTRFICESCNLSFESLDDAEVHVMNTENKENDDCSECQEYPTLDVKDIGPKVNHDNVNVEKTERLGNYNVVRKLNRQLFRDAVSIPAAGGSKEKLKKKDVTRFIKLTFMLTLESLF